MLNSVISKMFDVGDCKMKNKSCQAKNKSEAGNFTKEEKIAIYERVRQVLEPQGYKTMQEIADFVGRDRQAVYQWSYGRTKPDEAALAKIAEEGKTTVDWLLRGVYDSTPTDLPDLDSMKKMLAIYKASLGEEQDTAFLKMSIERLERDIEEVEKTARLIKEKKRQKEEGQTRLAK